MKTFWTIGHSTHTPEKFIELLKKHSIQTICDVRSQPYSKYTPQFNKENIEKHLQNNKINYLFFGEELGGRSNNPSFYIEGKLQYDDLSQSSLFQEGLSKLILEIKNSNVALMCSEGKPLICHRSILVCRELFKKTNNSEFLCHHILPDSSLQTHKQLEKSLLDKFKISPDMLRTEEECIKLAYSRQGEKIAFSQEANHTFSDISPI